MPFVQRVVEPKFLARTSLKDADGRPKVNSEELQAVTNCTLSNALRQLASLVLLAEDVFADLTSQLHDVVDRSKALSSRIILVEEKVSQYDPKKVPVPEGSLSEFAIRKVHFTAKNPLPKELFTVDTRPRCVRELYKRAANDRLSPSFLEQLREESSRYPICTPVIGSRKRRFYQKINAEIETHIPTAVEDLRKWTSKEAIGEVTVLPDASTRIASGVTLTPEELSDVGSGDDEPIDHQLPSPEEQLRVIVSKFAPEIVPIDTSGKFFDRMCTSRKSLANMETLGETDTVKRRTRSRKPRGKRRNTISGTDQKELREAIAGETSIAVASQEIPDAGTVVRSHSSDLLKKSPIDPVLKKSHFNSLKQWGKSRLRLISRSPSASRDTVKDSLKIDKSNKEIKSSTKETEITKEETVTMRRKRNAEEERDLNHQRCGSYSSSEKSIGVPTMVPSTATISAGVKMRGASIQRRLRRSGITKDEPHSSSGNWSASSESGRTSIGSEITTTTIPPKSTTSAGTSSNSLNVHHGPPSSIISRRRFLNTSGSGSVTSEGTLTPDIIHDFHEDMETSSEYSCDTEGYYTSFHMDSGLKTLKEEDISPCTPLHTSTALSNSSNSQNMSAENEYELFGKGSTSTTTSSAGTVCTTLKAAGSDRSLIIGPAVPERKSSLTKLNRSKNSIHSANSSLDRTSPMTKNPFASLRYGTGKTKPEQMRFSSPEINLASPSKITITSNVGLPKEMTAVAEVHLENDIDCAKKSTGTSSPDSGHNTSSSPIEDSVSSAQGKTSLSEQDYSESSDLEGTDRIERIRYKTTINSSRIPSLCVITPSNSDDESITSHKDTENGKNIGTDKNKEVTYNGTTRPRLDIPQQTYDIVKNTSANKSYETKPAVVGVTLKNHQLNLKNPLIPLNSFMSKIKGVLPHKLSSNKKSPSKEVELTDEIYETGEYVTIADYKNNNQTGSFNKRSLYVNETAKTNLQTVLSGKLIDTEYVSLNELPNTLCESKDFLVQNETIQPSPALEEVQRKGAKITLDANGQVIYSTDSIRRRKGAHTTFEPGPFIQDVPKSPVLHGDFTDSANTPTPNTDVIPKPMSPQLGKIIIKAPVAKDGPVTTEFIPFPTPKPTTIISAPLDSCLSDANEGYKINTKCDIANRQGAYVNIHDAEGVSLSPTKDHVTDYLHSSADRPTSTAARINQQKTAGIHRGMQERIPNLSNSPFQRNTSTYWTLPKKINDTRKEYRPLTPTNIPYVTHVTSNHMQGPLRQYPQECSIDPKSEETLRISPIDPRTQRPFQSSTPTEKENLVNLGNKLLSPIKSTMTNEELYAVIHKSKKKLNIKDPPDRADSPALSTVSLSPVSSESSLIQPKGTSRLPETGYLMDPRTRNSWAYSNENQHFLFRNNTSPKPESTCADRHGTAQTSRLEFKKLLLQHGVKSNALSPQTKSKISAVEQLKMSKEKSPPAVPPINVPKLDLLDLSGSPKTYTNRKQIRPLPPSPGRAQTLIKEHKVAPKVHLSPKSQWRFASPRSDVLSSPIPEANNEEDTSGSNSSGERHNVSTSLTKTVPIKTKQTFGARRNLLPINETIPDSEANTSLIAESGVIPFSRNHSFVTTQSRAGMIKAKRDAFFSAPEASPPPLSSFKGTSPTKVDRRSPEKRGSPSPNALETAL